MKKGEKKVFVDVYETDLTAAEKKKAVRGPNLSVAESCILTHPRPPPKFSEQTISVCPESVFDVELVLYI